MKLQPFQHAITRLRKERGLSLPKLAAKARISKGLLWTQERNPKANPSLSTLVKIARALGVDVSELIS